MIAWIGVAAAALLMLETRVIEPRVLEPRVSDRTRLDSLADATAAGIARFEDRRVAIAEGYRRIGTDFPSMGEHWILPAALLGTRLDAARPTVLAYAVIDGKASLLGAGFIVTTRGNETPEVPGWPTYWHEHSGALSDESGAHVGARDPSPIATHVWVLHIWTALPNPLGRYDSDNWALPFARAGLSVPEDLDHDLGRALSLTVGAGNTYLNDVLQNVRRESSSDVAVQTATMIEAARVRVAEVVTEARPSGRLDRSQRHHLRALWRSLATELRRTLGAEVDAVVAPPHLHHVDAMAHP